MGPYGNTQMGAWQGTPDDISARRLALSGYDRASREAGQAALGTAASVAGANPFGAMRMAAVGAAQARANISGQRAEAEGRMIQQQQMMAEMRRREAEQQARQVVGGIVGGAGQVLGTIMPALAPAAGALGGAIGGQPMGGAAMGGIGQAVGALTGGAGQPGQGQVVATNAGMPGRPAQPVQGPQSMAPAPSAGPTAPPAYPGETQTIQHFGSTWTWDPQSGTWNPMSGAT